MPGYGRNGGKAGLVPLLAKALERVRHAARDAQFRDINGQAGTTWGVGDPMISVDARKKENAGPVRKTGGKGPARAVEILPAVKPYNLYGM